MTEWVTVEHARGVLVDRCMQRFGFDFPQAPFSEVLEAAIADERVAQDRVWGLNDQEAAATHGFAYPETGPATDEVEVPLSPAYHFVLTGQRLEADGGLPVLEWPPATTSPGTIDGVVIPPGGCGGEADRTLGTGDPNVSMLGLARDLGIEAWSRFLSSKTYRAVVDEWVACMAARGHHVTDVLEDHGDIARVVAGRTAASTERDADGALVPAADPSAEEVALATATVECKEETNLVHRLDSAMAKVDEGVIEEHQLALEEDRKRLDAQVKKATALVEEAR